MKKITLALTLSLIAALTLTQCTMNESQQTQEKKIKEIVSSMTLEEKAQLVIGTGMYMNLPIPEPMMKQYEPLLRQYGWMNKPKSDKDTVYTNMVDRIRTYLPGCAGTTAEFLSKGIKSQVMADGPAGLRIQPNRSEDDNTYYCTAFPIATVLASTWDTELVQSVGEAMGKEVLEYGADILLAPGMNLQRDPLCGRNFEYYSEDPLVTGKMAAAMVKGVQSNGVGTSIKHFAVNNQETNRKTSNTIVSVRALRELYLRGFEIAVKEAQPWTVMSSYNYVNGVYTSESYELLTTILRDDWGFEGYVVTDWISGSDLVAQMEAGNDLIMPGRPELIKELILAVEEGRIEEQIIDRNITRILGIMMKAPRYNEYQFSSRPDLVAHASITRQTASDGMVLLKNADAALPLP
jgi:beta-glucosidase